MAEQSTFAPTSASGRTGRTIEQIAQELLDRRGYVVITSNNIHPPGKILKRLFSQTAELESSVVVVCKTTIDDYWEQHSMVPEFTSKSIAPYFYRVIAE